MQAVRCETPPLAVLTARRHQIFFLVCALDAGVFTRLDTVRLAAPRVAHHVAHFVLCGPLSVRSRYLLPGHKYSLLVFLSSHLARALHRSMDRFVAFPARLIVRADY